MCMCVMSRRCQIEYVPSVYLNGVRIKFVEKVKYLGYLLTSTYSDNADIERQTRFFYISANMLLRKFYLCSTRVKCKLFKVYCYQLYGGSLWFNYNTSALKKLKIGYNNAARILLGYDRRSSASSMFVSNRLDTFDAVMRKQMYSLMKRISNSENTVILKVRNAMYFTSVLRKRWIESLFLF